MSEHIMIEGEIDFWHLPYEEEGSFSYCHHCKKPKKKLQIELHGGALSEWIQVRCPTCKKTIWIAELTTDEEEYPKSYGGKYLVKEKNKCAICGKETNKWDCISYSFSSGNRINCICSMKCERIRDKKLVKKYSKKENK